MLTHDQIWNAIDALAARRGVSASSLAKMAGLDPTTFNRSKRNGIDGNPRWPSTESIAKILAATQISIDEFLTFMKPEPQMSGRIIPFRMLNADIAEAFDAAGKMLHTAWEQLTVPSPDDGELFALGICGEAHLPVYRDGDILILSPSAALRNGDRMMIMGNDGDITIVTLKQATKTHLHLKTLQGEDLPPRKQNSLRLLARILWVSQ